MTAICSSYVHVSYKKAAFIPDASIGDESRNFITGTRKHVISVKPQFTVVGASLGSDVRFDFLVGTDDGDLYE